MRKRLTAVALAAAFSCACLFAFEGLAQGMKLGDEPAWLRDRKTVSPLDGSHCCGPQDCWTVPDSKVRFLGAMVIFESKGRVWVYPKAHVQRRKDAKRDWMICRQGPGTLHLRCAFRPFQGV